MKKTLIAIAVSAALAAPAAAYAENDIMIGAGFGLVDVAGVSVTGYMLGAQFKLNDKGGVGVNYHEGDIFSVSYRGYFADYADGLFWEGGIISAAGVSGFEGGVGYDIPLQNKLSLRVAGGAIVVSGSTAFAARGGVFYSF